MTPDLDLKAISNQLRKFRDKHGAHSRIGWSCSTLIEQLRNYPSLPKERQTDMERKMWDQVVALERLTGSRHQ